MPKSVTASAPWRESLSDLLPYLGHRNWIAVVDSAYPLQIAGGIEMLCADEDMASVLEHTLSEIDACAHISATIFVDKECDFLEDTDAGGISAFRMQAQAVLENRALSARPHEEIIAMIDEAATRFRVVVIKARCVLPYTSVFCRLDCGYWDEARERRLMSAVSGGKSPEGYPSSAETPAKSKIDP